MASNVMSVVRSIAGITRRGPRLAVFAALAVAGLLAGCATEPLTPPPPLMSPLALAKDYGYASVALPGAEIQVTYLGPRRRVPVRRAERAPYLDRAKAEAADLALWRAAQLALARKAKAFMVTNRSTDADTEVRDHFQGYSAYHYYTYRPGFGYYGYFPYDPFPHTYRTAYAQARARLDIKLLDRMRPGAYDAKATDARLRAKWSSVTPH
jgi:hypothetical protein